MPSWLSITIAMFSVLPICAGAGKSSIVSALLRLRPIQSGFIMAQGDDASTLSLKELQCYAAEPSTGLTDM
jgi:ABC-type multidrug transport system fused ATPase/permease subunit